jgi:large subunit ribosomal protein L23
MQSLIVKPIISEKSMRLAATGTYMFGVPTSANKPAIVAAISAQFKVEPIGVRVSNLGGKTKRFNGRIGKRVDQKRAYVTLKKGQKIDAFTIEEQK